MMGKSGLPAGRVLGGIETWMLWVRVLISDNSKGAKTTLPLVRMGAIAD